MATTIVTKYGSDAPAASNIVRGELAVDTENGRLYTENSSGAVVEIGLNPEGNVDVTGTVTADGLTVSGSGAVGSFDRTDANAIIELKRSGSLQGYIGASTSGDVILYNASAAQKFRAADNGDISFYEDTGTTAKFFWDASAESLGIGNSSPDQLLQLGSETYGANAIIKTQVDGSDAGDFDAGLHMRSHNDDFGGSIVLESRSSTNDIINFKYHNNSSAGVSAMAIDATNGNVGIGTASPSSVTHLVDDTSTVYDATAYQSDLTIERKNTSGSNQSAHIRFNVTGYEGSTTGEASIGAVQTANASSADLVFTTRNAGTRGERMRITSAGRVGINEQTPLGLLHLRNDGDTADLILQVGGGSGRRYAIQSRTDGSLATYDSNAGAERMRIDASGNLLVGKTAAGFANTGHELRGGGSYAAFTRDGGSPVLVNRKSSDGTLVEYMKDGTTVGSISASTNLNIGSGGTRIWFRDGTKALRPVSTEVGNGSDGIINIGEVGGRFKDLYLSGGAYLGGTGAANKLEDYEEGTFNPSVTTSSGTISISVQEGKYVKVGDVVHYWIRVAATCTSTAVLYNVDGLPFTTAAYSTFYAGPAIANAYNVALGTNATVLGGYYLNNTSSIRMHSYGNQTAQLSPSVAANSAFELRFEGSYRLTA